MGGNLPRTGAAGARAKRTPISLWFYFRTVRVRCDLGHTHLVVVADKSAAGRALAASVRFHPTLPPATGPRLSPAGRPGYSRAMCGLAGVMTRDGRPPDPAVLDRLMAALRHRGPDAEGQHLADGVALVHTRLSIVDLQTGDQPLFGARGLALVANAEIYNDPALRAAMPERGVPHPLGLRAGAASLSPRTGSASPAICAGCMRSPCTIRRTGGWCWRATRSASSRSTTSRRPAGFAFASEPQALLRGRAGAGRDRPRAPRRAAAAQVHHRRARRSSPAFFACCPGETLAVEGGRIVGARAARPAGPRRRRAAISTRCCAIVSPRICASDVPYGLFLSGGIDCSALLWLMHRATGERVQRHHHRL